MILAKLFTQGRVPKEKTAEFETFIKKGGWGQNFVQTKILLEIVTRGGGLKIFMFKFCPLEFCTFQPIFWAFSWYVLVFALS